MPHRPNQSHEFVNRLIGIDFTVDDSVEI